MINQQVAQQQTSATEEQSTDMGPILQRKTCSCGRPIVAGGECAECRKKRLSLQRQAVNQSGPDVAPPIVHEVLRSPGRPLDPAARAFMEPRFGQDFSQVRVHTDARAVESARLVNASAYTVGRDVVFGAGQYTTSTAAGRRLLAHELTHVVQQRPGKRVQARLRVGQPNASTEIEADKAAARIISGGDAGFAKEKVPTRTLQRFGDPAAVPPAMSCPVATSSPAFVIDNVMFDNDVRALTPAQKLQIENFVVSWRALGGDTEVRVDGYASKPGAESYNWQLSCDRAQAVEAELLNPSSGTVVGVPANLIRVFAHGETDEFSSLGAGTDRRVSLSVPAPLPPTPTEPPASKKNGCQTTKSVTIDLVRLSGSNRDPASDLAFANTVFRQCCVRFVKRGDHTATRGETTRWLGGDQDLQRIHSCSSAHQEEKDLRQNVTARFGLTSRYKVFYVRSMTPPLRGVNFSPDCSSGDRAPFNRHLYVANSAARRTLAHELGHIPIRGLRDHSAHGDGTRNLMEPTNTATGEHLTDAQCVEVRNNI